MSVVVEAACDSAHTLGAAAAAEDDHHQGEDKLHQQTYAQYCIRYLPSMLGSDRCEWHLQVAEAGIWVDSLPLLATLHVDLFLAHTLATICAPDLVVSTFLWISRTHTRAPCLAPLLLLAAWRRKWLYWCLALT